MLYSVPFLRIAASFGVASFYLHVCRTTVAMETNFPLFCSPLSILSHGYDDIQTSNELLLIFTINIQHTPQTYSPVNGLSKCFLTSLTNYQLETLN